MARNLAPKCKQCRREGQKLFLKGDRCNSPKCAMVKRNFPPGVHGGKGYGRQTGYGIQLREKQKAKRIYGLLERQFENYFAKAKKAKGNTEESFLQNLEMRLDNIIYKAGFAKSRNAARQAILHNCFLVNGKKVNIPSFLTKPGNIITLKEKSKDFKIFSNLKEQTKKLESFSWFAVNPDKMEIKITDKPRLEEIKSEFDPKLIIEFYSR